MVLSDPRYALDTTPLLQEYFADTDDDDLKEGNNLKPVRTLVPFVVNYKLLDRALSQSPRAAGQMFRVPDHADQQQPYVPPYVKDVDGCALRQTETAPKVTAVELFVGFRGDVGKERQS